MWIVLNKFVISAKLHSIYVISHLLIHSWPSYCEKPYLQTVIIKELVLRLKVGGICMEALMHNSFK